MVSLKEVLKARVAAYKEAMEEAIKAVVEAAANIVVNAAVNIAANAVVEAPPGGPGGQGKPVVIEPDRLVFHTLIVHLIDPLSIWIINIIYTSSLPLEKLLAFTFPLPYRIKYRFRSRIISSCTFNYC